MALLTLLVVLMKRGKRRAVEYFVKELQLYVQLHCLELCLFLISALRVRLDVGSYSMCVCTYTCHAKHLLLLTLSFNAYACPHAHAHVCARAGDDGSPTSVVCTSNLRRAAQTAAVALWDRLRPDDDDEALAAGTQPGSYPEQVKVRSCIACMCGSKGGSK